MVIDLRPSNLDLLNYSYEYKIKSGKLITALNRLNHKMIKKYNYIIIPMSVYNIIECSEQFESIGYDIDNKSNLKKVGFLGEFECYLDIYANKNEILVSWDKSTSRDIKIDNLLSISKSVEFEKKIEIIF